MKSNSTRHAKFLRVDIKADFTKLFEEIGEIERNIITRNSKLVLNESMIICFFI